MKKFISAALLLALVVLGSALHARTIYLTRHGQVGDKNFYNATARETMITPLGREQASLLGDYLIKKYKFNGTIMVSPLYRTVETGIIVADKLNKKVILEPGIQEIATGPKQGRFIKPEMMNKLFPNKTIPGKTFNDNWRVFDENAAKRQQRVAQALDRILAETKGDILLVSHGGTCGSIIKYLNSKMVKGVKPVRGMTWNCSLFVFNMNENDQVISGTYTTEYMSDDMATSNFRVPKVPKPNDPRYEVKKPKAPKAPKAPAKSKK